jgi:gliding motility-associated-like protein
MRMLCLLAIFLFCSKPLHSQFYEIYGPNEVDMCADSLSFYGIETSEQISRTFWTIIPDATADLINPDLYNTQVQFYFPGIYTLIATSSTVNQQILTDTFYIAVSGLNVFPEVLGCYETNSSNGCYRVCAFSETIIQNPGGNVEFEVIGAESYLFINPGGIKITWGAGGIGEVIFFSQTCDITLCFEIFPEPVADFTTTPAENADTVTVCKNQEVLFENHSSNGLSYMWNFGDGSQSQDFDASHAYAQEGFYTVTLSAESICDCSDEKQIVVEVLPAPAPTLDCVNSVCPETRQRYTATTTGCTNYTWSVSSNGTIVNGGGPMDDFIEVIWHEGPDGYIDLSVSGCSTTYCSFTNRFRVPIISPDGPIEGDAYVCSGEVATYTAPYFPGTQYNWQVGPSGSIVSEQNKNAITVKWEAVNTTTTSFVVVEYDNCFLECGGQDQWPVTITPEIKLNGDVQVCQDGTGIVNATSGFSVQLPASVNWQLEDEDGQVLATSSGPSNNWSYTFAVPPGIYTWVALNSSPLYCTEIARLDIEVTATPLAPISIVGEIDICPGQPYGYTIESAGNYSTLWTITDGSSTSTYLGQTCQHTFGFTPPYIVQAVHTDIQYMACASDPVSITLSSAADLTIDGPDEVCFNAIDTFSTQYVSGTDYVWEIIPTDHGEIRRSDLNRVEVFWTQTGSVILRLNACGVTIDKVIRVNALPVFNLVGPIAACANETVTLTTDQPFLPHVWSDENNNIIDVQNSIDVFPGSYAVQLTDINGCVFKKPFQITSYPFPSVHLSTASSLYYCVTLPGGVDIVANTDGADYAYMWFLDDVAIGPGGPVYNVTAFGSYHVEVTNQYGCSAISQKIKFTNCCPPDICGAGIPGSFPGCTFLSHNFSITSTEAECHIHRYMPLVAGITPGSIQWIIESSSIGVLDVVQSDILEYTFAYPGYYTITMLGLLNGFPYTAIVCGHYENLTDVILAVADFKHEGLCAGAAIQFEDLTTLFPGETIASWNWDFGDPASGAANISSAQDPTHTYASAGVYEVTLVVTLASGCSTTKKLNVSVSAGPVLTPVYDLIHCEDEAMAFQLPGQVFDIQWTFGDPASGSENTALSDSVFHTFNLPGFYLVTVSASDIYECATQASFLVDITQNVLSGLIDVDPVVPLCSGDTATLTAPAGGVSWLWSTDETADQIQVTESNQYNVLIRDQYHCTYSPPAVFVEVFPKPEVIIKAREILGPNQYGPWSSSLQMCYGTEFEITAFSSGNVSFHWTHGPLGPVLQFTSEGANLPDVGTHEFAVNTIDLFSNCISDSSMILIEIFELPNIPVVSLVSGTSCSFDNNILQVNNPQAGVTYLWSDGQAGTMITVTKEGLYDVEAINDHGCISKSNSILILPSAPVDQIPGGCFIECDPLTVCLPPLSNVVSYTIYKDGSVFLSGTSWPGDYLITMDGSYTIEVTTANGCTATSEPLDVMLYTGTGSITVLAYYDTNGDGLVSAGDALLPGIPVQINSLNDLYTGMTFTETDGDFVFEDYPASTYTVSFDQNLLPSQWKIVIDSVQTDIMTCEDSVVVSLLLTDNCSVTGPDQQYELCPGELITVGDSTWTDTGTYTMHMPSALGCDSIFQVELIFPDSLVIGATVWVDVDHNGVVSPADTVIQGITILFDRMISIDPYIGVTGVTGSVGGTYPVTNYQVYIDTLLLPAGFEVVYGVDFVHDTVCGVVTFNFLITGTCSDVFFIQQEELCPGDSLSIEGQWITTGGVYNFILHSPGALCDSILDVYVTVLPDMIIDDSISWNCQQQGAIVLSVTGEGPFQYDWSNQVPGDSIVSDLPAGDYSVTITDDNGCTVADTFTILDSEILDFYLADYYEVVQGDSVEISIMGDINVPGLHVQWDPAIILNCDTCVSTFATPVSNTILTIEITDADSCVYILDAEIIVLEDTNTIADQLYIPNVFSPNGDGINDHWTMYSRLPEAYVHEVSLFDRWGALIFYKEDFLLNTFVGWDGTFRGKTLNPSVFAYIATLTLGDGREVRVKGDVTLVR